MKNNIFGFAILLITLILTQTTFADVKIKARQTVSGQTSESTVYIKGKRMRSEQNAGGMETINLTQCDLKRSVRVMPASQTYMIDAWLPAQNVAPTTTVEKTQAVTEKGGVITMTVTTKDTGERKQMFGYTARRIITTMESVSSPDACNQNKTKMETDGWYIDAAFALNCQTDQYGGYYSNQNGGGCQDRHVYKNVGKGKTGYPVLEKITMFDQSGKESFTMMNEVLEISNTTLDAALFDVPGNYREVKDATELYASMSNSSSASIKTKNDYNPKNSSSNAGLNPDQPAAATSAIKSSSNPGEKKAGVVRIGIAHIKTGAVGEGINALELAATIKNTLGEYLDSPQVEMFQLEAKLPSAIDAEAKSIDCDVVIYATVSHKKGGGGFGMFKKIAPAFGNVVPVAGLSGNVAGAVAGQVASTLVYTAAGMAANVKSKDEMTLDVKVQTATGSAVFAKQYKAKAKSDGDDIISPIVEQAAQAILDAVAKK